VDLSLAASAWQKYQRSVDRISIKELKLVQVNYRYSQAAAPSPPQEHFYLPAPFLRADDLDQVLHNFLVILAK
jgi:hypothetical protein